MMEAETWLTAEQAKEKGLIDGVMFEKSQEEIPLVAGPLFSLPGREQMEKVKNMLKGAEESSSDDSAFLMQLKLNFLKLKGERA